MSEIGMRMPADGVRLDMACRCCGERAVELVLDLGDQPHCNRLVRRDLPPGAEPSYPLRLGFCRACGMVQIDHTIPKENMFSDYPYVSGTTATLPAHFRATAARIAAAYDLRPGDLVVDIGSNDGTWLKQYGNTGCRILGVEPAANVAALATEAGVPTLNAFFNRACAETILARHGPARIVTAAGVFFHLEELHSVTAGIERLLAPDGVLVVQAIYLGGMLENTAFDQIYHEHLCYYTLRTLSSLLDQHDLEVFEATLLPIHGGSLEAHIARKGSRAVGESVGTLLASERNRGYGEIETYRRFARDVVALRDRLVATLRNYRTQGRSVWAYGAPAKGATLLNSFAIGTDLVQQAVEKSPLKIGLAIPGARLPIEAEGGGYPDVYLVLAWNFIEEFLSKEKDFLERGGELLVPIPSLRSFRGTAA